MTAQRRRNYLEEGDTPDLGPLADEGVRPTPRIPKLLPYRLQRGDASYLEGMADDAPAKPLPYQPQPGDASYLKGMADDAPARAPIHPDFGALSEDRKQFDPMFQEEKQPSGYDSAIDAMKKLVSSRPVMEQPKWWQRLAAGAAGAASGWENATGRTRPIDVAAVTGNLLHPGYQDKLSQWQSRVVPAEALLDLEGKRMSAQEKAEQIHAQAEERLAHAQLNTVKWRIGIKNQW